MQQLSNAGWIFKPWHEAVNMNIWTIHVHRRKAQDGDTTGCKSRTHKAFCKCVCACACFTVQATISVKPWTYYHHEANTGESTKLKIFPLVAQMPAREAHSELLLLHICKDEPLPDLFPALKSWNERSNLDWTSFKFGNIVQKCTRTSCCVTVTGVFLGYSVASLTWKFWTKPMKKTLGIAY